MSIPLYCDTHGRCYDFKELPALLESAHSNFSKAARAGALAESHAIFVLFIADVNKAEIWNKLSPMAKHAAVVGKWSLSLLRDGTLVRARSGEQEIILAPALARTSSDGVELLVLGSLPPSDAGQDDELVSAQSVIDRNSPDSVVIAPWSAEKWLGKTGKVLSDLISRNDKSLYLGDCSTRPWLWKWSRHFKQSSNPILSGSRPHPLRLDYRRVGSYGVRLDYLHGRESLSLSGVVNALKSGKPNSYGRSQSLLVYFIDRLRLLFS